MASAIAICPRKTAPQTALLLLILLLIAVIQVLPQVDLPDTEFQLGTAPIIAKSRTVPPRTFGVVIEVALLTPVRTVRVNRREDSSMLAHAVNRSLPVPFSTLLC